MIYLDGFAFGLLAGAVLTVWLLWRAAHARAAADVAVTLARETPRLRREAAGAGRAAIKARLGTSVAPELPFAAADVRFVGDPVHLAVFDGHTDVKDGAARALHEVCLVTVTRAGAPVGVGAVLVEECVAAGRVRWLTISVPAGEIPAADPLRSAQA